MGTTCSSRTQDVSPATINKSESTPSQSEQLEPVTPPAPRRSSTPIVSPGRHADNASHTVEHHQLLESKSMILPTGKLGTNLPRAFTADHRMKEMVAQHALETGGPPIVLKRPGGSHSKFESALQRNASINRRIVMPNLNQGSANLADFCESAIGLQSADLNQSLFMTSNAVAEDEVANDDENETNH